MWTLRAEKLTEGRIHENSGYTPLQKISGGEKVSEAGVYSVYKGITDKMAIMDTPETDPRDTRCLRDTTVYLALVEEFCRPWKASSGHHNP